MDNNFNQNQNMNQNQYQNQYQNPVQYQNEAQAQYQNQQYNAAQGNGTGYYQPATAYAAPAMAQKANIPLGALGALGGAIVGTVLWVLITAVTETLFFILGVGIAFLTMFLYQKLAKKMDVVGVIICTVLTCIAIYLSNRYGNICMLAFEGDMSISDATTLFDWFYALDSEVQTEYITNMVLSYVIGIGYSIVMVVKGIRR